MTRKWSDIRRERVGPVPADARVVALWDFPDGLPEDVARIDRRTPYGNPFKISDPHPDRYGDMPMTREDVIEQYAIWLAIKVTRHPDFLEPLRGKRLACWCAPLPCHGDVILEFLDGKA